MNRDIKVFVVENDAAIRESLSALIEGSPGFVCVGSSPNAESARIVIPNHSPDVVMMDVHLSGISGIECIRQLKPKCQFRQFIILTVYYDDSLDRKSVV